MSFKSAEEQGLIATDRVVAMSRLAKEILRDMDKKGYSNVEISECLLKLFYTFDKMLDQDIDFRKAIIASIFKMWEMDAMQFAIDIAGAEREGEVN